jgi:hypothetical protein
MKILQWLFYGFLQILFIPITILAFIPTYWIELYRARKLGVSLRVSLRLADRYGAHDPCA